MLHLKTRLKFGFLASHAWRQNKPIQMKFGMEACIVGQPSLANFGADRCIALDTGAPKFRIWSAGPHCLLYTGRMRECICRYLDYSGSDFAGAQISPHRCNRATRCTDGVKVGVEIDVGCSVPNFTPSVKRWGRGPQTENFTELRNAPQDNTRRGTGVVVCVVGLC